MNDRKREQIPIFSGMMLFARCAAATQCAVLVSLSFQSAPLARRMYCQFNYLHKIFIENFAFFSPLSRSLRTERRMRVKHSQHPAFATLQLNKHKKAPGKMYAQFSPLCGIHPTSSLYRKTPCAFRTFSSSSFANVSRTPLHSLSLNPLMSVLINKR